MHQDFLPAGIVVLTGAGISKESGIDTFRDKDGLWNRVNLEDVATIEAWHRDKKKVLDFYNETRKMFRAAHIAPNAAHKALAHLEQKYDGEVTIVTQNIDPLHEQAGSRNVIHMHGRDGEIRCMHCGTVFASDVDLTPQSVCAHCKTVGELRPNIVWFGEMPIHMDEINAALERCGLFVAIGTSGEVYPAAGFVLQARRRSHVHTVELNLEPTDNQPLFQEHIYGPATRIVPPYVEHVLKRGWPQ
ncbi:MAG TPA: NAD-dependent deacylase [Reyranella sp.]|jgi:NAD-dependent deacetylase|nr:NAD-dependent deacylase [Reyranella sp.]